MGKHTGMKCIFNSDYPNASDKQELCVQPKMLHAACTDINNIIGC